MRLSKSKTEMGMYIDMSCKKFRKSLEKQSYNLGMYTTLLNMMQGEFQRVVTAKDEVVNLYCKQQNDSSVPKKELKKTLKTIKKIYVQLGRIEQKVLLLREIRDDLLKRSEAFDASENL